MQGRSHATYGGFPVLVLNLTGDANPGPEIVEGWGLEFPVSDDAGNIMMCPRLSESGKIMPGERIAAFMDAGAG